MILGGFVNKEDIAHQFAGGGITEENILKELNDSEILVASYINEAYEGYAFILYSKNGVLYEVNGSHCSCNGLEGQWSPEETNFEAISMRYTNEYDIERLKRNHGEEVALSMLNLLLTYEIEKNVLK